jgi:hypothetical protein
MVHKSIKTKGRSQLVAELRTLQGEQFPVMYCRAERLPGGTPVWRFFCPHCSRRHTHAAEPGHRVAHCDQSSPFYERGYILALKSPPAKYRRPRPR